VLPDSIARLGAAPPAEPLELTGPPGRGRTAPCLERRLATGVVGWKN
jgi:hypothetical protein